MKALSTIVWYVCGGLAGSVLAGLLIHGLPYLDPARPAFVFVYYAFCGSLLYALILEGRLRDAFFLVLLLYFIILLITQNQPPAFVAGHTLFYGGFMIVIFLYVSVVSKHLFIRWLSGPIIFAFIYALYAFLLTFVLWLLFDSEEPNIWSHSLMNFMFFGRMALILAASWEITRWLRRRVISPMAV